MIDLLNRQVLMLAGYALVLLWIFITLKRAHRRDQRLNITDVLTGDNGLYASMKVFEAFCFVTHTFGTVFLVVVGTEGLGALNLYATVWALRASVKQAVAGVVPAPPQPTTVTTTAPAGQTVTTQVG